MTALLDAIDLALSVKLQDGTFRVEVLRSLPTQRKHQNSAKFTVSYFAVATIGLYRSI